MAGYVEEERGHRAQEWQMRTWMGKKKKEEEPKLTSGNSRP